MTLRDKVYFVIGALAVGTILGARVYYFYSLERYVEVRLNPAEIVRCELLVAPNEEVSQILFNSFMQEMLKDPPPPESGIESL